MNDDLLEQLADLEHQQWAEMTKFILENENISFDRKIRWLILIDTPYSELTESQKEKDRKFARKVIELIDPMRNEIP